MQSLRILTYFGLILSITSVLEATSTAATPQPLLRLMPHSSHIVKSEGEQFAMACIADYDELDVTDESYTIYWEHPVHGKFGKAKYKNYGRSVFTTRVGEGNKLMLNFKPAMRDDSGVWTCTAYDTDAAVVSKNFTFEVIVPTKFDETDIIMYVNEKEEHFLPCDANGSPKPEIIVWEYNDSTIDESYYDVMEIKDDGLQLKSVTKEMNGTYKCTVHQITRTVTNTASKAFHLIVNYAPVLDTENRTIYAMLGTEVSLTCRAKAQPNPQFSWYHVENHHHIIANTNNDVENSTLTILITEHTFGKKYKCEASNTLGKAIVYYHILEGKLPEVPDTLRLLGRSTMSFDIEIGTKNEETYPVIGYRFELIPRPDDSKEKISWKDAKIHDVFERTHEVSRVVIHNLEKDTVYLVRAAARNMLGLSEWTDVKEFATLMHFNHKSEKDDEDDKVEEQPIEATEAPEKVEKINKKHHSKEVKEVKSNDRIVTITPSNAARRMDISSALMLSALLGFIVGLCNKQ